MSLLSKGTLSSCVTALLLFSSQVQSSAVVRKDSGNATSVSEPLHVPSATSSESSLAPDALEPRGNDHWVHRELLAKRAGEWDRTEHLSAKQYIQRGAERLHALDEKAETGSPDKTNTAVYHLTDETDDSAAPMQIWRPEDPAAPYYIWVDPRPDTIDSYAFHYSDEEEEPVWGQIFGDVGLDINKEFTQVRLYVYESGIKDSVPGGGYHIQAFVSVQEGPNSPGVFIRREAKIDPQSLQTLELAGKDPNDLILEMMAVARAHQRGEQTVRVHDASFRDIEFLFAAGLGRVAARMIPNSLRYNMEEETAGNEFDGNNKDMRRGFMTLSTENARERQVAEFITGTQEGSSFAGILNDYFAKFGREIEIVQTWCSSSWDGVSPLHGYQQPVILFQLPEP